ncbi:hypothetical protein H2199_006794 [Coniosporium tulheliwenetii]|uniref:Uncharacterized protein n=1 Tax=Coniosporium tulheliwenetii TaxID=3383036 RepID=A0ACC2YU93_9PEZI|nr:hypothetical protein H2199_006794 [Cladosporium sp. JES 115]
MEERYRMLAEGQGGTFEFPHPYVLLYLARSPPIWSTAPTPLGTKSCLTCVGVYFQIDANRAFTAHILPHPSSPSTTSPTHTTISLLTREAADNAWGPPSELMRKTLVLVCPFPTLLDYVRARQRAGCFEAGMSEEALARVLEGCGEGEEEWGLWRGCAVVVRRSGRWSRRGRQMGSGGRGRAGRGEERWRKYWREGAHGFVVRDLGAQPEFWYVKKESLKRGFSVENTGEEDGWVGEEIADWEVGDWRVFG